MNIIARGGRVVATGATIMQGAPLASGGNGQGGSAPTVQVLGQTAVLSIALRDALAAAFSSADATGIPAPVAGLSGQWDIEQLRMALAAVETALATP